MSKQLREDVKNLHSAALNSCGAGEHELREALSGCALRVAEALDGLPEQEAPARIAWMHARCVYIRELTEEGNSPEEIARTLGMTDVTQVRLIAGTDPNSVIAPYRAKGTP